MRPRAAFACFCARQKLSGGKTGPFWRQNRFECLARALHGCLGGLVGGMSSFCRIHSLKLTVMIRYNDIRDIPTKNPFKISRAVQEKHDPSATLEEKKNTHTHMTA
jgi:hypothetical protein